MIYPKKKYENELRKAKYSLVCWNRKKEVLEIYNSIDKEKKEMRGERRKLITVPTTKLIVAFIFINCTVVEIYSMWVMYKLADLSALYTLITAVVGESVTFITYAVKSTKENTVGGIVYDKAMKNEDTPEETGIG